MDKYYERLEFVNQKMTMMEGVNKYDLLVFAELDNLEYVVEKYRLGHISDEQAYRGWRAFRSRCKNPRFCEAATKWVQESEGYQDTTSDVVERTVQHCRSESQ